MQDQTCPEPVRRSLPNLWLFSDARNDAQLEQALAKLPRGSGFIFRHYHLDADARQTRFATLRDLARTYGHIVILADTLDYAQKWAADGTYGASDVEKNPNDRMLRLATAHNGDELRAAAATKVDGVFLSPVFPTRSHPGAQTLGVLGFRVLAQQVDIPVIALGGMTVERAEELDWDRWGAIDGLV